MTKFKTDYPTFRIKKNIDKILTDMLEYEKYKLQKK